MYDVIITNCNTLEVKRMQLDYPLDALCGMDWVEMHAQHEVKEQIDFKLVMNNGDKVHIKAREVNND